MTSVNFSGRCVGYLRNLGPLLLPRHLSMKAACDERLFASVTFSATVRSRRKMESLELSLHQGDVHWISMFIASRQKTWRPSRVRGEIATSLRPLNLLDQGFRFSPSQTYPDIRPIGYQPGCRSGLL